MRIIVFVSLILSAVFWSSAAHCEKDVSRLESMYRELRQYNIELLSDPASFDVHKLLEKFKQLGFYEQLNNLPEHSQSDLSWLFRSVSSIVFYDPNIGLRSHLESVFFEIDRRDSLQDEQMRSFYHHLIRFGELDNARKFALEYEPLLQEPLPDIPEVVNGGYDPGIGPSVLRVKTPNDPLIRENIEIYDDVTILIQFDPACSISSSLMSQMAVDAEWKSFISQRAYLIASRPTDILRLDAFHAWNENSPFEVFLVENISDWPFISQISTPSFYVLREGQEVESFSGFSSDAMERLVEIMADVSIAAQ